MTKRKEKQEFLNSKSKGSSYIICQFIKTNTLKPLSSWGGYLVFFRDFEIFHFINKQMKGRCSSLEKKFYETYFYKTRYLICCTQKV